MSYVDYLLSPEPTRPSHSRIPFPSSPDTKQVYELLKHTRQQHKVEIEHMKEKCSQELQAESTNSDFKIKQLRSKLNAFPSVNLKIETGKLARLQHENTCLREEIQKLEAQKTYVKNRVQSLTANRLQPLDTEIRQLKTIMSYELSEVLNKHKKEINLLKDQLRDLDIAISAINSDISEVSQEIKHTTSNHSKHAAALQTDIEALRKEVSFYNLNNEELIQKNSEILDCCELEKQRSSQIEHDLSRLKDINYMIKPKAQRLEHLVYGRGISPIRNK